MSGNNADDSSGSQLDFTKFYSVVHRPKWHEDCLATVTVAATALSQRELKRFLRSAGWRTGLSDDPGRNLEMVHQACHSLPEVSKRLEKKLNERFGRTLAKAKRLSPEEIRISWQEAGHSPNWLWAAVVDERSEVRGLARHMIHDRVWSAFHEDNPGNGTTDARVQSLSEKIQSLEAENRTVKRQLRLKSLMPRETALAPVLQDNRTEKILKLKQEVERLKQALAGETQKRVDLESLADQPPEPVEAPSRNRTGPATPGTNLEAPLASVCPSSLPGPGTACVRAENCRDCPLAGQRVMVVGGVERLEPAYREVVRQLGGRLSYHGGHTDNGGKKLKKQAQNADVVVFFTSVNSHAALAVIKDTCRKKGVPLMAVKETGVKSLEKVLRNLAA